MIFVFASFVIEMDIVITDLGYMVLFFFLSDVDYWNMIVQ